MNATNKQEQTALAPIAPSTLDAMAIVTLSPEKYAAEVYQPYKATLATAIESVKAIDYDIQTTAGMAAAVKCRALFRDLRIAADKERKARKEPITKIGKLLESGFDQVEERIAPLEDLFDSDIKSEEDRKEAVRLEKIRLERVRIEAIQIAMNTISERETNLLRTTTTAAEAQTAIADLVAFNITNEIFSDRVDEACSLKQKVLGAMAAVQDARYASEAAALAAEEARQAEAARIEAERMELARLCAEAEKVANEQAAERKRLTDLAAAQEAAAAKLREQAEANLRAEREAQEEVLRREREEAAAELQRKQDEFDAQVAAHEAEVEAQRIASLPPEPEPEPEPLPGGQHYSTTVFKDNGEPILLNADGSRSVFCDIADDMEPTDDEIIDVYVEAFGGTRGQAVARLLAFVGAAEESRT